MPFRQLALGRCQLGDIYRVCRLREIRVCSRGLDCRLCALDLNALEADGGSRNRNAEEISASRARPNDMVSIRISEPSTATLPSTRRPSRLVGLAVAIQV